MATVRKPFQGVWNIIRFNWHFYVFAFAIIMALLLSLLCMNADWSTYILTAIAFISLPLIISLLVSWYVYDYSDLYSMRWLDKYRFNPHSIINVNAGFDEFSSILKDKFSSASLFAFDFYDALPQKEISIVRAQKAYPTYISTKNISLDYIPLKDNSVDLVFLMMAAHEIRNDEVRKLFFKELKRILCVNGKIIVVEHLRDRYNFLAYTIGFFHFLLLNTWLKTFNGTGLTLYRKERINPFVSLFILQHDGNPL